MEGHHEYQEGHITVNRPDAVRHSDCIMSGYVKLFRKLADWEWYSDSNTFRLFIHCLIKANYEEKKWRGQVIKPGSFVTSTMKLADELHLTRAQIRYSIHNLQNTQNLATKSTNKYTVITVLNWAEYQVYEIEQITNSLANQSPAESPTNRQPIATTKEYKEIKNKELNKKDINTLESQTPKKLSFVAPSLDQIEDYCTLKKLDVVAADFYEYFTEMKWIDSKGEPVKNWKGKLLTWNKFKNGGTKNDSKSDRKISKGYTGSETVGKHGETIV